MLAGLLLIPLFVWSAPASPSVSLPSVNGRQSAIAFNKSAELWSLAPFNKSSRVVDSLTRDTFGEHVGCRIQEPRPVKRIEYLDCLNAAWKILQDGIDIRKIRRFSRHGGHPDSEYLVPVLFMWKTCFIIVDTLEANDHDMLSLLEIRRVALRLIEECVKPPLYEAGKDLAGPKQVIKVLVFGQVASRIGTAQVS